MEEQGLGKIYKMNTRIIEETPVKIVFENGPYPPKKRNMGCLGESLGIAIILIITYAVVFHFYQDSLYLWLWAVLAVALLWVLSRLIREIVRGYKKYKSFDEDLLTLEETIIIDLATQHAKRIEKMQSGKIRETDFDLRQVNRVLIRQGHGFLQVLYLEFSNEKLLELGVAFKDSSSYLPDTLIAHGQKIGKSIDKPVVRS